LGVEDNIMDIHTMQKHISIIFDREIFSLNSKVLPWSLEVQNNKGMIKYEHAETLVNLYVELQDSETRKNFIDYFTYNFVNNSEYVTLDRVGDWEREIETFSSTGALIFFTLLQLGFKDILMKFLKVRTDTCLEKGWTNVTLVHFLNDLLKLNERYFDIDIISELLHFSKNQKNPYGPSYNNLIIDLQFSLANLGYDEVKESISGINIEINRDKERLISIFSNNFFDKKYEYLLKKIDEYINTNSTIVTSGMVGNMRSFMEGMITDLARKIAANCNEQIPELENMKIMGWNRNYLKIKLELSDNDNQLINKYIDVLHTEGGHSFISNVEYFRLAKNIGIEISLFLLSKANNLNLLRPMLDF
jgi:hypothetical protein